MTLVHLEPGHPWFTGKRKKPEPVTPPELWPEEYEIEYGRWRTILEHQADMNPIEARHCAEILTRLNALVDGEKL